MALQVFISNPESGEASAHCGAVKDKDLIKSIGYFLEPEIEQAVLEGKTQVDFQLEFVEMTEEEVKALPEL